MNLFIQSKSSGNNFCFFTFDFFQVTLQLRNSFEGVEPFGVALSADTDTNTVNRSHESSEETRPLIPSADQREETSSNNKKSSEQDHPIYPRSSNAKGG